MQRYIGVKVVDAEPQEKDDKPGYRVVYPDKYESWSPKRQFEDAYMLTSNMDFGLAYKAMVLGFAVTRESWPKKRGSLDFEKFLYLGHDPFLDHPTVIIELTRWNAKAMPERKTLTTAWTIHQVDVAGTDWKTLEHLSDMEPLPFQIVK